jgi:hypothetical protein
MLDPIALWLRKSRFSLDLHSLLNPNGSGISLCS